MFSRMGLSYFLKVLVCEYNFASGSKSDLQIRATENVKERFQLSIGQGCENCFWELTVE